MKSGRPTETEFAPYAKSDIDYVIGDDAVGVLAAQGREVVALLESLDEESIRGQRYAPGKWTVKEVIGHCADGERVFSYRLLRIARRDKTPLAGFEENEWAATAPHRHRPMAAVVDEFIAVRRSTLALIDSLDETAIASSGVANNNAVTARAICWILAGHARHHLTVLAERYGLKY